MLFFSFFLYELPTQAGGAALDAAGDAGAAVGGAKEVGSSIIVCEPLDGGMAAAGVTAAREEEEEEWASQSRVDGRVAGPCLARRRR